jgi:hypothetical protein
MRSIKEIILLIFTVCTLPLAGRAKGEEDVCECVKLKTFASDTLRRNSYLNYKFSIKNTCSSGVWINTSYFSFAVYNGNGKPTPRIRELTFVKRYTYPEFVLIAPNAEYEFKYADDPFFEYKLERHTRYIVGLRYDNKKHRNVKAKGLNYLCTRELRRSVYIK